MRRDLRARLVPRGFRERSVSCGVGTSYSRCERGEAPRAMWDPANEVEDGEMNERGAVCLRGSLLHYLEPATEHDPCGASDNGQARRSPRPSSHPADAAHLPAHLVCWSSCHHRADAPHELEHRRVGRSQSSRSRLRDRRYRKPRFLRRDTWWPESALWPPPALDVPGGPGDAVVFLGLGARELERRAFQALHSRDQGPLGVLHDEPSAKTVATSPRQPGFTLFPKRSTLFLRDRILTCDGTQGPCPLRWMLVQLLQKQRQDLLAQPDDPLIGRMHRPCSHG